MTYTAGWNIPGCLPDTTEDAATFDTFNEAVAYLAQEAERFWDQDQDLMGAQDYTGPEDAADARWLPVHTALHNAPVTHDDGTHTFSETCGDGHLTFWIQPTEEGE